MTVEEYIVVDKQVLVIRWVGPCLPEKRRLFRLIWKFLPRSIQQFSPGHLPLSEKVCRPAFR